MTVTVLDREVYDEPLAASLLRMPAATLHYWLEGGSQRRRPHPPILRPEATGSRTVTWGEFVEARYLLGYRRELGVQMHFLRGWIARMRELFGVPYPLAHLQPWVGEGRRILDSAQRQADLPAELWAMWTADGGQLLLTAPAESFLRRIEFVGDEVARIRPVGTDSPLVIDPLVRFGAVTIHGIPTEAIADQVQGGDPVEMVADDFDLPLADVVAVLDYELRPDLTAA